ncbi:kinase-like domain-containing protein [Sporodiniella umbellata]|nr:kinase-like domain-containing protein [Sporodiniella umbellata]
MGSINQSKNHTFTEDEIYERAVRIVEEENKAKCNVPSYPELNMYQLITRLGDGAFSKVYDAIHIESQEKVAIKVIRKADLNNQQKTGVLKEVQLMRGLNSPYIIKLLDFKETKEYFFLILEVCEGGELFHQIIRLTYLSEDLSRHCIRQVAEGIRYLHEERGIVHRDIKPENLLFVPIDFIERETPLVVSDLDEPKEDEGRFVPGLGGGGIGQVKIADFGLSKIIWDQQTRTPCGTVGYTAPEIVKDERYSMSVDIWALGCVLYTLLCGFPPFYDESIPTLTEKVAKGSYTFLSPWWDTISDQAQDLVSHLLEVDPDKRYTIRQFFEHPWMTLPHDVLPMPSHQATQDPTEAEVFKRLILERDQEELEAAAPSSGVSSVRNSRVHSRVPSRASSVVLSGATTPRRDLFSGVSSMKEMFDISYTVHRMAEENARQAKKNPHSVDPFKKAVLSQNEQDISTTEEDSTDDSASIRTTASEQKTRRDQQIEEISRRLEAIAHHPPVHPPLHRNSSLIELSIENSALLTRRKKAEES